MYTVYSGKRNYVALMFIMSRNIKLFIMKSLLSKLRLLKKLLIISYD